MQKRRRVRDNVIAVAGIVAVAALATFTQVVYFTAGPGVPSPAPSASETPAAGTNVGAPDPSLAEGRTWTGTLTLNDIPLGIELDGAAAPQAVAGWVQDVQNGYYLAKDCHRMGDTPGFELLQCGSLDGTGTADPGFSYGPVENAPADGVYPAGTIAMARAGDDAYSNGHQFFLVTGDTSLPADSAGGYTVVGHVTSGLDQLIASVMSKGIDPATVGADGTGKPLVPTVIRGLTLQ
jgi:peptidyl-prolyl cis-trans isomerase B (cyclophilin B)